MIFYPQESVIYKNLRDTTLNFYMYLGVLCLFLPWLNLDHKSITTQDLVYNDSCIICRFLPIIESFLYNPRISMALLSGSLSCIFGTV
jgi:hypothetical protein